MTAQITIIILICLPTSFLYQFKVIDGFSLDILRPKVSRDLRSLRRFRAAELFLAIAALERTEELVDYSSTCQPGLFMFGKMIWSSETSSSFCGNQALAFVMLLNRHKAERKLSSKQPF